MNRTVFIYILLAILALVFLFVVLRRVGLIKSKTAKQTEKKLDEIKQEKKTSKNIINKSEYFKPSFWKQFPQTVLLNEIEAVNKADDIYQAWGLFNDDEEEIYGVFRSLTNKAQVSQLADQYQKAYKTDLAGAIIDKLNDNEAQKVFQITDAL
jgi:hypothetical protein